MDDKTVKPGKPPQGAQEEVNSKSRMKRIAYMKASSSLDDTTKPVHLTDFSYDANGSYIDSTESNALAGYIDQD